MMMMVFRCVVLILWSEQLLNDDGLPECSHICFQYRVKRRRRKKKQCNHIEVQWSYRLFSFTSNPSKSHLFRDKNEFQLFKRREKDKETHFFYADFLKCSMRSTLEYCWIESFSSFVISVFVYTSNANIKKFFFSFSSLLSFVKCLSLEFWKFNRIDNDNTMQTKFQDHSSLVNLKFRSKQTAPFHYHFCIHSLSLHVFFSFSFYCSRATHTNCPLERCKNLCIYSKSEIVSLGIAHSR